MILHILICRFLCRILEGIRFRAEWPHALSEYNLTKFIRDIILICCCHSQSAHKDYFLVKNAVFWDVAPCRYCITRRYGGTYHLHLQSRRKKKEKIRARGTSVSRWLQTKWPVAGSSLADFFFFFFLHDGSSLADFFFFFPTRWFLARGFFIFSSTLKI
jgi:hypothetical protein